MNIGQLAKQCATTSDTVRYYEKLGLLERPPRQNNGYRLYTQDNVIRIKFIKIAKQLGYSLSEIGAILPDITQGQMNRTDLENSLSSKLKLIDEKIVALEHLRETILAISTQLKCNPDEPLSLQKLI